MLFVFDFYSSLLLVFFVHMLVYAVLLLIKYNKSKQQSNFWLACFLVLAVMYIFPWMVGFAGWYGHQPYRDILFYVPFHHLFFIGPVVYFYVHSLFNPSFKLTKKEGLHFLPGLLYMLFSVVMWVYDKLVVGQYYFLQSQQDPDFDTWYQLTGFMSMTIYFLASIRYYYRYKQVVESILSNSAEFLFLWMRNFLIAFLVMLVSWILLAVADSLFKLGYANTWWYFFGFSICSYYIAIAGYANAVETKLFFKSKLFGKQHNVLLYNKAPKLLAAPNYNNEFEELAIDESHDEELKLQEEFVVWKQKIQFVFNNNNMYLEPELTLYDVAKALNTNISMLSKAINVAFNCNFNDLVNGYRITAFESLVMQGEHKKQTLLSLAYDCGFNSKSTFNRAFKKVKGMSPQEFVKTMQA